jgi:hypothetical protein
VWVNEKPGWGVDIDEAQAAKYPFPADPYNGSWMENRQLDGTVVKP